MNTEAISTFPTFAAWLKHTRKSLDLTQKSLALRVGCSAKLIEKIELGERRPSLQVAELLMEQLQVPAEDRAALIALARSRTTPSAETSQPAHPNNLPAPLTSFVGRRNVLPDTLSLIRKPGVRLVTLVGPPGIGKTRLSLQMGHSLLPDFADGVFFVPLASTRSTDLVASSIAQTLSVPERGGQSIFSLLSGFLQTKQLLLILDNFEQIVEAAPLLNDLLAAAPGVKMLVSSREVLRIYGEHVFQVPPLDLPSAEHDAHDARSTLAEFESVRLFAERASAALYDFQLDTDNASSIAGICRALDGLPLALELAAARASQFSIPEMHAMLERKLDLLVEGPRDMTARQRTIRGAIDWSYDLLDDREKLLFRGLSVFAGGFSLESVEAVCADLSPLLDSLANKSLVEQQKKSNGALRYRMLEVIREYAWQVFDPVEAAPLLLRHAHYFVGMAESAETAQAGPEQAAWLDTLAAEHDNIRAALRWLLDPQTGASEPASADLALRMSGALAFFWYRRGHLSEGSRFIEAALARAHLASPAMRGKALNGLGTLAYAQGRYEQAKAAYAQGLDAHRIAGDKRAIARSLNNLGLVAGSRGDYASARDFYDEAMLTWKELSDKSGIALSLNNIMSIALALGDYEEARNRAAESVTLRREMGDAAGLASSLGNLAIAQFALGEVESAASLQQESLTIRREIGDRRGIANCLVNLGEIMRYRGNYSAAKVMFDECFAICSELEDKIGQSNARVNLGYMAQKEGHIMQAKQHFQQSAQTLREMGDRRGMAMSLIGLAEVEASQGDIRAAARLIGEADATLEVIGSIPYLHERRDYDRILSAVRMQLSDEEWARAWSEGRAHIDSNLERHSI